MPADGLHLFHPAVATWFRRAFEAPTRPQRLGWPAIARGDSALVLAPTGTGKTLAAFLWCLDRLMFGEAADAASRCRVIYVSPLKALAVDVERNLRAPLAGIANVAAAEGLSFHVPAISVRTGDTPTAERARFQKHPGDILITTPESLYLLLTSNAYARLRSVETVIVDEIHALVSTKRGAHLALSLERLERLVDEPLQRVGLSATQRPLAEVARFLGGAQSANHHQERHTTHDRAHSPRAAGDSTRVGTPRTATETSARGLSQIPDGVATADISGAAALSDEFSQAQRGVVFRPVTIVDASQPKPLSISVQVPVEDMSRIGQSMEIPSGPAAQGPVAQTIWTAIHPRLLELIRGHRSTLLFVNSRRLAERLAAALNELAGEPLVRAHHGSLARAQRAEIEDLLKTGQLKALVATSSLELGIDMGAIDLVVQIEAPPSVTSGLQRVGRAGHRIDEVSTGIVFPKFRGDLVACAAVTRAMLARDVEPSRYPRNPLDVLAQQIVAMASMERWSVDDLFSTVRQAAPYADLSRRIFEGVLDMLSGRYPSDDFAELRPRVTWDRVNGKLDARQGARRVAIANAGTIPDRGLFGVFLAGGDRERARVGELDEEMVFEARRGETFLLGASTWRIEEITHDRVLVSPAPGEPGKMPFWKGETGGRPVELGLTIGKLVRELRQQEPSAARERLAHDHGLEPAAADNLLAYLEEQARATGAVPDDRTLIVERCRDELGDWRICVLSALGTRVHAPWAMAVTARIRQERGIDVESMWTDDGFVVRFPDVESPPDPVWLLPDPEDVERLVVGQLGSTALFAARFREAAGRALLLPRRRPGGRTPLWHQRKRAADLLAVAAKYGSFPIILETYREVLRDIFDLPALTSILRRVRSRSLRVVNVDSTMPSPFAASLLFGYVASYIYDGDAPLAERRAQALAVDQSQLRELIGDAELRDLLDVGVIETLESELQHLPERYHARSTDAVHDLLLRLGDLTPDELAARSAAGVAEAAVPALTSDRRVLVVAVGGERRIVAVEDAARYRDALGVPLPAGLPETLLEPVADPHGDLVRRFARTHGPFTSQQVSIRYGLGLASVESVLARLVQSGRIVEGAFRPGGHGREWSDPDVLRTVRRRSLARLRHEVEPVDAATVGRFALTWHGITHPRRGLDALLDVVEHLQGAPLIASLVETDILPSRIADYAPAQLDMLMGAGEVVWVGLEPLGDRDGRIAFYLTEHLGRLLPPGLPEVVDGRERAVVDYLRGAGASFFAPLHEATGGGFPKETLDALWSLVWQGLVTNDTLHPLRAYFRPPDRARRAARSTPFRSRRLVLPSAEGRWSVIESRVSFDGEKRDRASLSDDWRENETRSRFSTEWSAATAQQLLVRHGLVTREVAAVEQIPGGFSAVYPVLSRLEETGRVRRGYFVSGLGAAQFAQPGAVDLLRARREESSEGLTRSTIAATDPANPYGALLPWPAWSADTLRGATRSAGARVVIVDGRLAAWIARGDRQLFVDLPADEPDRSHHGRALALELVGLATGAPEGRQGWLVEEINGKPASDDPVSTFLIDAGFRPSARGLQLRVPKDGRRA
ncbi:MAG: DEAD/DEAH box helicase [Vicinamibacterales bacterium]